MYDFMQTGVVLLVYVVQKTVTYVAYSAYNFRTHRCSKWDGIYRFTLLDLPLFPNFIPVRLSLKKRTGMVCFTVMP
jgi:hypothetical protein